MNQPIDPYEDPSKTKKCARCHETLEVIGFYRDRHSHDGLISICKSCCSKRSAEARAKNPERVREIGNRASKKWQENNPDKRRSIVLAERRRAASNLPNDFTRQDWQHALAYFNHSCAVCGTQMNDLLDGCTLVADHWKPMASGGGTIPENMIPLCHGKGGCNNKKRHKDPVLWLTETYGTRRANAILAKVELFFSTVRSSNTEDKSA